MTDYDDWKHPEPIGPLKDTRSKKEKAREARVPNPFDTVYIPLKFPDGTTGGMCVARSELE